MLTAPKCFIKIMEDVFLGSMLKSDIKIFKQSLFKPFSRTRIGLVSLKTWLRNTILTLHNNNLDVWIWFGLFWNANLTTIFGGMNCSSFFSK